MSSATVARHYYFTTKIFSIENSKAFQHTMQSCTLTLGLSGQETWNDRWQSLAIDVVQKMYRQSKITKEYRHTMLPYTVIMFLILSSSHSTSHWTYRWLMTMVGWWPCWWSAVYFRPAYKNVIIGILHKCRKEGRYHTN